MKNTLLSAIIVFLIVPLRFSAECAEPGLDERLQLRPITLNRVLGATVDGPPSRQYEPLMMGGDFQRHRINELFSFFPELKSLGTAKGIEPVDLTRKNRVVLQLKSKVNGSFTFDVSVLEGDSVWTCGGKYFRLRKGWSEFLEKEFVWQEKDRVQHSYPKILRLNINSIYSPAVCMNRGTIAWTPAFKG